MTTEEKLRVAVSALLAICAMPGQPQLGVARAALEKMSGRSMSERFHREQAAWSLTQYEEGRYTR